MFKPEDWESIGDLSQSKKAEDVLKVGRFGIGFQSVHHITGKGSINHNVMLLKCSKDN